MGNNSVSIRLALTFVFLLILHLCLLGIQVCNFVGTLGTANAAVVAEAAED